MRLGHRPPPAQQQQPAWLARGRARQARASSVATAASAVRAAAAAEAALWEASATTSGSTANSLLHRYQQSAQPSSDEWAGYKYQRFPCASPVDPKDVRCLKIEVIQSTLHMHALNLMSVDMWTTHGPSIMQALFQNVLGFPRLPPRLYRFLLSNPDVTVESATACVEALTARYGKELSFYMLRRTPLILNHKPEDLLERAESARRMLDLKPQDIFMLLRKNPMLMVMTTEDARSRFNKLHHVTPLSHEASRCDECAHLPWHYGCLYLSFAMSILSPACFYCRIMVIKCPLVLNR